MNCFLVFPRVLETAKENEVPNWSCASLGNSVCIFVLVAGVYHNYIFGSNIFVTWYCWDLSSMQLDIYRKCLLLVSSMVGTYCAPW
jgi:hypothetical protein